MVTFVVPFFFAGLAVAMAIWATPGLYRLLSERPEIVIAAWPTSLGLMVAGSLGRQAVVITAVENGALYALLGAALWLLVGRMSTRKWSRLTTVADRDALGRGLRRYAYRVLGFLFVALGPLALAALYLGSGVTKAAILASTPLGVVLVARRPIFPLSHVRAAARIDSTLASFSAGLERARARTIPVIAAGWLLLQLWVVSSSGREDWAAPELDTVAAGVVAFVWAGAGLTISLAATSALLWLACHVVARWRQRTP